MMNWLLKGDEEQSLAWLAVVRLGNRSGSFQRLVSLSLKFALSIWMRLF